MAGRGPAPKDAAQRRRRNEPARGEWLDLPAELAKPILPNLPARGKGAGNWSARTRAAWKQWRADPATGQYGPAEIQGAIDLAYLYEEYVRGKLSLAPEIRLRQDGLGLTMKGKRDLRWRVKALAEVHDLDQQRAKSKRAKLEEMKARAAAAEGSA